MRATAPPDGGKSQFGHLTFTAQEDYRGFLPLRSFSFYSDRNSPGATFSFTGTVNAEGQVRLRMEGADVELTGTLRLGNGYESNRMVLTFAGGPRNGQTFTSYFRNGY